MQWFYLILAGFFEVGWAVGLKFSDGFTKIIPSIFTVVTMAASLYFLSLSLKTLPLSSSYAIWTGIGTIGTVILGIIIFKEPISVVRIVCVLLIVAGIVGLKLVSSNC